MARHIKKNVPDNLTNCDWKLIVTSLSDSTNTWSYSLSATRNMMDVTFSKQWIHLRRSDLWPPTSTMLNRQSHSDYHQCRFTIATASSFWWIVWCSGHILHRTWIDCNWWPGLPSQSPLSPAIPRCVDAMSTGNGFGHSWKRNRVLRSSRPCYRDWWHTGLL